MDGQVIDKSLDRDAFTPVFSVLPGVLPNEEVTSNDTDPDGHTLTIDSVTQALSARWRSPQVE